MRAKAPKLPFKTGPNEAGMAHDIANGLDDLGLGRYVDVFAENEIDLDALPCLGEDDLKEIGVVVVYPNGDGVLSVLGSHVENSGTRTMMMVTARSDRKKIMAPRSTVWMGIRAMPLTA